MVGVRAADARANAHINVMYRTYIQDDRNRHENIGRLRRAFPIALYVYKYIFYAYIDIIIAHGRPIHPCGMLHASLYTFGNVYLRIPNLTYVLYAIVLLLYNICIVYICIIYIVSLCINEYGVLRVCMRKETHNVFQRKKYKIKSRRIYSYLFFNVLYTYSHTLSV